MAETRGPTVTAVAIIFGVLAAITITLRLWARALIVRSVCADDILICVAVLLSWAFMIATILSVQHGLGSHIEDVMSRGPDNFTAYMHIVWLSSIFYNACLGFIKISVLALYMRLEDKSLRRLAIVMLGVVICQAGGNVMACIFQCSPVRAAYDITIPAEEKRCININAFYLANAAVNILTDFLTYTLPLRLVTRLHLPWRQKAGLAVMLCLGLFACVSSIIRITFIPQMLVSEDATWVITSAIYWSVIEINIGILAASIPSFKSIARRYFPRLLGSSYEQHYDPVQERNRVRDSGHPANSKTSASSRSSSGFRKVREKMGFSQGSRSRDATNDNNYDEEVAVNMADIGENIGTGHDDVDKSQTITMAAMGAAGYHDTRRSTTGIGNSGDGAMHILR